MSDSEAVTTALTAALYFGGNQEHAHCALKIFGYMPRMLKKSRFCHCPAALSDMLAVLFRALGTTLKEASPSMRHTLDSFPVEVCDNIRIARGRFIRDDREQREVFQGKYASRHRCFFGVRVPLVLTEGGLPVEFALLPGSAHDTRALDVFVAPGTEGRQRALRGRAGYTRYWIEDALREEQALDLQVCDKGNAKRRQSPELEKVQATHAPGHQEQLQRPDILVSPPYPCRHFWWFQIKICLLVLAFTLDRACN